MTQKQIQECCRDLGSLPYKIQETFGEGIVGKEYYTDKADKPREVRLEITSFHGVVGHAVHYYGSLKAYHPPIRKEGSKYLFFGYLGEDTPLFENIDITIELCRYLTKRIARKTHSDMIKI